MTRLRSVPSPSSKIETSDIDCGTGSMRSTMTTLGMKMLPMHELIMQLSWNPIAKAFHGKSPLHLALNMIVDNERDREPVPVSFMNVLQEIAIETTEVDCSDENLPLKPLRPGNKLITSLKTLKNSAPPKRAKKQFRGLDEIHKFMELRGKKHKHAAENVHTTVVGRDVTNKAIRLPSRNFTMEEALASVELLPAVDKETVTQLPSSVHVLQNRPLIGSLLNRYRIDLMGVDACATLPNSSERSAQIQADIIVDEYTAIVLQPLNSLLRKVVDDRVTFVDAVAVGLAARFQTVVIVFEAYDPRSDVRYDTLACGLHPVIL